MKERVLRVAKEQPKKQKIICADCKKEEATIEFCNSVLEFSHGFTQHICANCYKQRLLNKIEECKKAITELDKKEQEKREKKKEETKKKNERA